MLESWTTIAGFFLSGAIAVGSVAWIIRDGLGKVENQIANAMLETKKDFEALLQLKEAEFDGKIGKVWERFDVYKNTCDGTFIRRETCELIHAGTKDAIAANRADLIELKGGQKSINDKLDGLILALVKKDGLS